MPSDFASSSNDLDAEVGSKGFKMHNAIWKYWKALFKTSVGIN